MSEENRKEADEMKAKDEQTDEKVEKGNEATEKASEKVEVVDGKATPTEETAEKIAAIQQADPAKQTTSEPTDAPAAEIKEDRDAEQQAKRKAAAEAREARAKERAAKAAEGAAGAGEGAGRVREGAGRAKEEAVEKAPKPPSPHQPRLDRIVQIIRENISAEAVEEAYINEHNGDLPTMVIRNEYWYETAIVLKQHEELNLNYMRNISGVDQETHMEVVYHAISLASKHTYGFKVKTNRDHPAVPSVTPVWPTANWNEREIYDLLGIDFPGHPDLRRIMMSDDWIGHPLRKDYEAADPEV